MQKLNAVLLVRFEAWQREFRTVVFNFVPECGNFVFEVSVFFYDPVKVGQFRSRDTADFLRKLDSSVDVLDDFINVLFFQSSCS